MTAGCTAHLTSQVHDETCELHPYGDHKFESKTHKHKSLSKAQSELDILKMNKIKESSLVKSKAYHKTYIDKLNKKYLKSQQEKKDQLFITEVLSKDKKDSKK